MLANYLCPFFYNYCFNFYYKNTKIIHNLGKIQKKVLIKYLIEDTIYVKLIFKFNNKLKNGKE